MAKRIASSVHNISDFPDELLSHIISFLPIKEAVRTSILSRRWRFLFSLITNLDLDINSVDEEEWKRFMKFVDRLLFYLNIPALERFCLRCNGCIDPERVGAWICALVWHKVQELDLTIDCKKCDGFQLPQNLFSCESLVVLELNLHKQSYELKVPAMICLSSLKVLHLEAIGFPDDGSEERLFSSCSVLEDLRLTRCWFNRDCVKFNVSNRTLKSLELIFLISKGGSVVPILVNAPNLIHLSYMFSTSHSLELIDVKSLSTAVFCSQLDGLVGYVTAALRAFSQAQNVLSLGIHYGVLRGLQQSQLDGLVGYVTAALSAFSQIQNVPSLGIYFGVLRDLQQSHSPVPLFYQMTYLTIYNWEFRFNPICLFYFLSRCVALKTLIFQSPPRYVSSEIGDSHHWDPNEQKSQLASLLCHLRTIEIQLHDIGHARVLMPVIEFFLNNASGLEKLKICCEHGSSEQRVEMMRKLMSFPRASNKCKVLF